VTIDPSQVARFEHGSRVPGWDDPVDLTKLPAEVPDPATTPVPEAMRAEIEAEIAKYPERSAAMLAALKVVQREYGWLTPEGVRQAACVMRETPAEMVGVASFYDMLDLRPVGRHRVYVCTNISCSLCGAHDLYDAFLEHAGGDPDFHVKSFECLGACDIAPMASVDGTYVGPLTPEDVPTLLQQVRDGQEPLPEKQIARRASVDPKAHR
jgi:NADH:ubiquinone oxidoreductase subunit E